jgi:6-pyruvoyltetrahydropterin/6-carboxytetrahydropterin synthase
MFTIKKRFEFSASHILEGLPINHQCARLHGHNYVVEVELKSSALNDVGFVRDYGELSKLKSYIETSMDHRHLNDVFDFNPTAENMAKHIFEMCHNWWPETSAVSVSETPKTWSRYAD